MLLVPLLDPAGVGGCHCLPHPERLIANQELILEREENRSIRRKTLEAQEKSTAGSLTYNVTPPGLVSVVRGTTRQLLPPCFPN